MAAAGRAGLDLSSLVRLAIRLFAQGKQAPEGVRGQKTLPF